MQSHSPKPNGRPLFRPTENHRKLAYLLASRGIPQHEIAETIAISPKTLRKHLRRELNLGSTEANFAVLKMLHKMARSGRRKHLAAAIFWAKSRCGFQPIYSPPNQLYIYSREKPRSLGLQNNQVKEHSPEGYV